jgi:serine protease AprX
MKRVLRNIPFGLAMIFAVLAVADTPAGAAGGRAPQGRAERLDEQLRAVLDDGAPAPQRVLIRVRPGSRTAVRQSLTAHGDQVLGELESIDGLTAVVHGEDLAELSNNNAILSVSADAIVRPHGLLGGLLGIVGGVLNLALKVVGGLLSVVGLVILPNGAEVEGPIVAPVTLRQTLGVDNSSWTGRGVGVAIIDSGLEYSSEFYSRITASYDFRNGRTVAVAASSSTDEYGHGTHVAGTIGGSGALSNNAAYRGLAPKVKFVVLKVLDKNGAGYTSDVIRAIDFAVANRASLGIHIINLSLGHPIFEPAATDPMVQAVERASKAGVIVVAAAGNYGKNLTTGLPGYAGITSPGNAPSAITTGAVNIKGTVARSDDRIPDYSSAGPTWYDALVKPDVIGPGHNIVAAAAKNGYLYKTYPQLKSEDADYMILSGTSMASAVTTGSVALLLEANRASNANYYPAHPPLTPNAAKAILQYTSIGIHDDAGIEYNLLRKGAGALNAKGAIDLGRTIDTSTATGKWWLTSTPNRWTTIGGATLVWNQTVVWGNAIIWGTTVNVNEKAWGSAIIWGTNTSWSSAIIWGTNLVWTDPQSWGSAIIWGTDTIGQSDGDAIIWGTTSGMTAQNTAWRTLSGSTTTAKGQ